MYRLPSSWNGAGGTVVALNGNDPWGGLDSGSGKYFLSIQGSGAYVEQTVNNLVPGATYEMHFLAAERPDYGGDEKLKVTVDGADYEMTADMCKFEKKTVKTSVLKFTPSVIEPSFGVDRLISGVFEHAYYVREGGDGDDGSMTRGVLALTPLVAPYKICLLPLDKRIKEHEHYIQLKTATCDELSRRGISYQEDDSGAAIGRRYARNDELGIPFACTFDFQTVEPGTPLFDTVTMRERDSCAQIRVPVSAIVGLIEKLCIYGEPWETVTAGYPTQDAAEKSAVDGAAPVSSEAYLEQHGVVSKLEDAFNDLMANKPSDPMGFLASKLQ